MTEVFTMVSGYFHRLCEARGSPGTAKTLNDRLEAIKKTMGHENERKAWPAFRLQFMSWCVRLHQEGKLADRVCTSHSELTAESGLFKEIEKICVDLNQRHFPTAKKFAAQVKQNLVDLLSSEDSKKVWFQIRRLHPACLDWHILTPLFTLLCDSDGLLASEPACSNVHSCAVYPHTSARIHRRSDHG